MNADLWERPELAHIRDFARSRRANPLSTLGVALVRATCQIPPYVVLPPTIGGRVALNLNVALVGPPGAGKGASEAAGRDCIQYLDLNFNPAPRPPEFPPGSGEGIARTLMEMDKGNRTALFIASEIDSLAGLFARRGQTLEAELRKMFMGESLGFSNANKDTKTRVEALSYRAGLIVGVQPLRAKVLLAGADGGTPQRFVWLPTRDPDMPKDRPAAVDPRVIPPIPFPDPAGDALIDLKVCDVAREAIDRHQVDYHRGAPGVDPLDGHALLTRLKVACGLMAITGRCEVIDEDWETAGRIMQVSRVTRASIQQEADEQRRQQRLARAADAVAHDEYVSDSKLNQTKRALVKYLNDKRRRGQVIARSDLRKNSLTGDLRIHYFDPAISELVDEGAVFKVATQRGEGYTPSTPSTPTRPADSKGGNGVESSTPTPPDTDNRPGETSNLHRSAGSTPPINGMDPTHADSNPSANEIQPPAPVEDHLQPDPPPGAPTSETLGYTDRVKRAHAAALANCHAAATPAADDVEPDIVDAVPAI